MSGNWKTNRMQRNKNNKIDDHLHKNAKINKNDADIVQSEKVRFKNADDIYE